MIVLTCPRRTLSLAQVLPYLGSKPAWWYGARVGVPCNRIKPVYRTTRLVAAAVEADTRTVVSSAARRCRTATQLGGVWLIPDPPKTPGSPRDPAAPSHGRISPAQKSPRLPRKRGKSSRTRDATHPCARAPSQFGACPPTCRAGRAQRSRRAG